MFKTIFENEILEPLVDEIRSIKDRIEDATDIGEAWGIASELDTIADALDKDCYDFDEAMKDLYFEIEANVKDTVKNFDI